MNKEWKVISANSYLIQNVQENKNTTTKHLPSFNIIMRKVPRDSFTWNRYFFKNEKFEAAPVSCFRHLPLSDGWEQITVGLKLEVLNIDCNPDFKGYWIASIIKVSGYLALLRYEGYIEDDSQDFWVNLANPDVHEVGWSSTNHCQLIPPQNIQNKFDDWKKFLVESLVGAKTLPSNFHDKLMKCLEVRYKPGMRLEALDKKDISSMRPCIIDEIVGQRLHLTYLEPGKELAEEDYKDVVDTTPQSEGEAVYSIPLGSPNSTKNGVVSKQNSNGNDNESIEGFWCHSSSSLIHPVGWSALVGHKVTADKKYLDISKNKAIMGQYSEHYAAWDLFPKSVPRTPPPNVKYDVGMKLEALDPVNLSSICVATIRKILDRGFIMISIDGAPENIQNLFCYHITSPYIFPAGFCQENGIDLTPPYDHQTSSKNKRFDWSEYLAKTNSKEVPNMLFIKETPLNPFRVGMKIEAIDLMEPHLLCAATITKVVGRICQIHFDGWDALYDQWVDCLSPDMYAVGWAEFVGYKLEFPIENVPPPSKTLNNNLPPSLSNSASKKNSKKNRLSTTSPDQHSLSHNRKSNDSSAAV